MPALILHITWNPSPYLIPIGIGGLTYYGLSWALSVLLGFLLTANLYRFEGIGTGYASKLAEYVFFSGLIGARLGQVFFYDWPYFSAHLSEIIKIWNGGLSSHGGALGILFGAWLFLRRYPHISYLRLLDILAVGAPLVGGLIRLGNLFNSEIVGKPTDVPWAFLFVKYDDIPRHPSVLYEAIMLFSVCGLLYKLYKSRRLPTGGIAALFFVCVFSLRILLESWKSGAAYTQLLSLPLILGGILLGIYAMRNNTGKQSEPETPQTQLPPN